MTSRILSMIYNILVTPLENVDTALYSHYPLTRAILPVLLMDLAYISFVFRIGPKFMSNRKPFNLKYVLIAYNLSQILINFYLFYMGAKLAMATNSDFGCLLKLSPNHPWRDMEVRLCYLYYINKYMDYLDTVFFVLRKSYRQVTFLHVYHHILMTSGAFLYITTFGYGGHSAWIGLLNSFVHFVMYTYYLLSSLNNELKQSLWWKKHITELQILQFVLIIVNQLWPLLMRTDCTHPKFWSAVGCVQAVFMLYLFTNFYQKSYLKGKDRSSVLTEKLKEKNS